MACGLADNQLEITAGHVCRPTVLAASFVPSMFKGSGVRMPGRHSQRSVLDPAPPITTSIQLDNIAPCFQGI